MEDFKDRLKVEILDLETRIKKLVEFLEKPKVILETTEAALLEIQLDQMQGLLKTLKLRQDRL